MSALVNQSRADKKTLWPRNTVNQVLMNIIDMRKLFNYNKKVRHKFLEAFETLPWEEFVRNREASFNSMKNIFLHTLQVEDRFVNGVVAGEMEPPQRSFEEYAMMGDVVEGMHEVECRTQVTLDRLTDKDLDHEAEFQRRDGSKAKSRIEDLLIHVFEEEIHHGGELIALFWQLNREPPAVGWTQYI